MVERFVYTEDVGSSTLSTPTILWYHPSMKSLLLSFFLLLLTLPAHAQNAPPEARPFSKEEMKSTSLSELMEQSKKKRFAIEDENAPEPRKTKSGKLYQPNVEIWLPPEFQSTEQKWPLIIFSHGFGGCSKQSTFLTQYLADNGYIVIAPDHADADCRKRLGLDLGLQEMRAGKSLRPEKPFRNPELWTDQTEADRKDDILFALSSMLDDRQYASYIDKDRIGLMGHSLGGYTVLGMAGAWPSWKDKRFKAVLALSPYVEPYLRIGAMRKIGVPVMYQGGTRDVGITPSLKRAGGAYAQTHEPKYYIEYLGANHFAWTEMEKSFQSVIQKTALEFFDKYLKEKPVEIDEAKTPKVSVFRKEEGKP